ncbi:D-Ala-D-Ala carboxypeptidase family metallohydrolase [Helicobacter trogontum]|uniref:DUF882 domain-containing protein n=1 Tax=Helicobacter trogontum TaxID=50960 RepID=A0A4U8SDM5_9HELI|nr:D-Ala-D-Ala carboxypeptidase family metallohydrolase [Helicobacter trogontum]TLD84250.1 DUF882 domain-containing protein [Helicobacter trogontum]
MKENPYFQEKEFRCKCCGKLPKGMPPDELVDVLVEIREHFGKPLIINSPYRCPENNKRNNGASRSRHLVGDAVDFIIKDVPTKEVFKHVLQTYNDKSYGIALSINQYNEFGGFVHLDTRGYKARWSYNKDGEAYVAELKKELNLA